VLIEHLGDQMLTYIKIAGVAEELCMKLPGHTVNLRYGDTIRVAFPSRNCLLFDKSGEAFARLK